MHHPNLTSNSVIMEEEGMKNDYIYLVKFKQFLHNKYFKFPFNKIKSIKITNLFKRD